MTDILALTTHQLRSPLSNIHLAMQLYRSCQNKDEYLDLVQQECDRGLRLIDDLLVLERLTEGSDSRCPIFLELWLNQLFASRRAKLDKKAIRLNTCFLEEEETILKIDPAFLENTIGELFDNALKYTLPDGAIEIVCSSGGVTISNQAELAVAELPRLFDRFYRVPGGDPNNEGGTGLGLAIVKQLCDRLKWTLEVKAIEGWVSFEVGF